MKKITLSFLFCFTLYINVCAQEFGLKRDSLPVFVVQDENLGSILDDFIVEAKKQDGHPQAVYHIYIELSDLGLSDQINFALNLSKQSESADSLILYKNPHFHQAFIRHGDVLFRTNIHSYADSFNYYLLTEMLKILPEKQAVYFKDPPSDYYDLNRRGGNPLEDTILDSFHEYEGSKWYHGIRIIDDDK